MAKTVRETFRQYLPGAGRNSQGRPVQGKTKVVGTINVTSYSGGEGEPLKANDIGLEEIDAIQLRVSEEISGAMSAGAAHTRGVVYAKGSGHFYLFNRALAGDRTGYALAATEVVEYMAEGDSAYNVELLS